MSAKFAEVTLGHKYRIFDKEGNVSGGAFYYLEQGLKEKNWPKLGKILATIFAICCIGGTVGGGNMVQSNQTVLALRDGFSFLENHASLLSFALAILNAIVLLGGIKRIAVVAQAVVPLMAIIFITGAICILYTHHHSILGAFHSIVTEAFAGRAVGGGMIGAMIAGFRRAAISSEAGLGSSPIAHATAKTNEPVREGCVALLETFIATSVICIISGLTLVVSGVYKDASIEPGVLLSMAAFSTVSEWFPSVLSVAIALFAYTTMITWSYYGQKSWIYLFGNKGVRIYQIAFCVLTYIGGIAHFGVLIDFSDMLTYSMALPNLIGLYFMQNSISQEVKSYKARLKSGEFQKNKKVRLV